MRKATCLVLGLLLLVVQPAGSAQLLLEGQGEPRMYGAQLLDYDVNGDGIEEIILEDALFYFRAVDVSGATLWSYFLDAEALFGVTDGNYYVELLGFIPFRSSNSRDAVFTFYGYDSGQVFTVLVSTEDNAVIFNYPLRWKYIADLTGDGAAELLLATERYDGTDSFFVFTGAGTSGATGEAPPAALLQLGPNRPNPFNPSTVIEFVAPAAGTALLRILTLDGREVWRAVVPVDAPGPGSVAWSGRDKAGRSLPSGVYLAQISLGGHEDARKITLLR